MQKMTEDTRLELAYIAIRVKALSKQVDPMDGMLMEDMADFLEGMVDESLLDQIEWIAATLQNIQN